MKNHGNDYQLVMILAFLILGTISTSACLGTSSQATGMYSAPTISATTSPTNQLVDIVSQEQRHTSTGDLYIHGIVKSHMNRPLTAWINVEFSDKNNMTLGTGETMVRLDMQGVSEFDVILENSHTYAHAEGTSYRCYVNRINY